MLQELNACQHVFVQISYLRRFKHLKTLNLSNNPFCEFDNYKQYVAAFLPHLDFLDYRLLDEQTVSSWVFIL